VADCYGLDDHLIVSVLDNAQAREVAPQTADAGYLISRHKRGSVILVVGHLEPEHPVVIAAYVLTDQDSRSRYAVASTARGQGAGKSAPTSLRQFSKRVVEAGYRMERGGSHMQVVSQDGTYVCAVPLTPSDHRTWANCWRTFIKASGKHEARRALEASEGPSDARNPLSG